MSEYMVGPEYVWEDLCIESPDLNLTAQIFCDFVVAC